MISPPASGWRTCRRLARGRIPAGSAVVVGVSGGGDSVALLRALTAWAPELGWTLAVAHLNHGVRGAESDADADFVSRLAESLGWPSVVGQWRPSRPNHFEEDARRARLGWLAEVARDRSARAVALAHTRDDQAETILHRICRGTGPGGLGGIPTRRPLAPGVDLVRPLLGAGRDELRAYLRSIGQPWREDLSNAGTGSTRARIRNEVLPLLESAVHPGASRALARLASMVADRERILDRRWRAMALAIAEPDPASDAVSLERERLGTLTLAERVEVIRRVWKGRGWPERGMDRRRWRRLGRLARREGLAAVDVGSRVSARIDRDGRFRLERGADPRET